MSNDLMLDVSQAAELKMAFRRTMGSDGSLWTNGDIKRLSEGSVLGGVLDVLNGRSKIVSAFSVNPVDEEIVDGDMDPVIRTALNVERLEHWWHPDQKGVFAEPNKCISGTGIYTFLKESGELERCLDLQDGRAIRRRGINFYQKYFKKRRKHLLWKAVRRGGLSLKDPVVPYLISYGDVVLLETQFLSAFFGEDYVTLKNA